MLKEGDKVLVLIQTDAKGTSEISDIGIVKTAQTHSSLRRCLSCLPKRMCKIITRSSRLISGLWGVNRSQRKKRGEAHWIRALGALPIKPVFALAGLSEGMC